KFTRARIKNFGKAGAVIVVIAGNQDGPIAELSRREPQLGAEHAARDRKRSGQRIVEFGVGEGEVFEVVVPGQQYPAIREQVRRTSDAKWRPVSLPDAPGHLTRKTKRAGDRIVEFGRGLHRDQ